MSMEIIKGKSILKKVAIGPILYHRKTESQVKRRTVEDTAVSLEDENGLDFLGLIAMMDPPREESKAAVAECIAAGIRCLRSI